MQTAPATRRLARQLVEAADLEGFFAANRDRLAPETVAELKEEVDRLVKVDLAKAEPLARATRAIAGLLEDPVSLGFGDAAVAYVHQYAGRLDQAEALFRSAIGALKSSGKRVEAAALERQLVGILTRQGRAAEALEVARLARRALARGGEKRLLAQLESNVGNVYFYLLHRHAAALKYFDRAHALLAELGDEQSLAVVDYSRANALLELDRPREAVELYGRSERRHAAAGNRLFAAQSAYMAAYGHGMLGHYGEALRRHFAGREQFVKFRDPIFAAWSALYLADLHLRLNVVDEATRHAAVAIDEFSTLEGQEAETARARVVRATIAERRHDYEAAEQDLSEAQATFDRLGLDVLGADARLARSGLAAARGDAKEAVGYAAEAKAIYKRARLGGRSARATLAEATAHRADGRPSRALRSARAALRGASKASDPWLECMAQALVGELELERGDRDAGIAALERAVAGVERLRARLRPGDTRAAFLADKLPAYERLVVANLERGNADGLRSAFRYVEMAKARALADLMTQHIASSPAQDGSRGDERVRRQLARRLEELSWYSARIDGHQEQGGQRSTRRDAQLRTEVERCERELASLFHRLEVEDSPLATAYGAEPIGIDDLAETLEPDEAVIQFFAASGRISALVVSGGRTSARTAYASLQSVERRLAGLRFQLEKFALGHAYARAHESALRSCADAHLSGLYAELLAPLEDEIAGKNLVVVPHGALHYVPFHALKRPDGRYVVEDTEVSVSPSATVHQLCARRPERRAERTSLLAVGLSDGGTPHISEELASIANCFDDVVRLEGDRARKASFLDFAPRSRFLHLATHGFFRQDNPTFSSVKLADGPLNFYDVFDLELDAELVTLSACNTGLSKLAPGDELSGLMRGFLYAGVPSLVVSLWSVNDRSTAELMRTFYQHLAEGTSKRRALRLAQLDGLERYGHPYYWAPFILMGKAR